MTKPVLHVVFGPSAAATLRQALAKAGREDGVVCPYDNLSFGPINGAGAEARIRWVTEELGVAEWDEVVAYTEPFIAASLSVDV